MLFKMDILERIARGDVTLAFRRWRRPTVKAGGSLRTARGVLAIDSVEECAPEAIDAADAVRAGYADRAALEADLADRDGGRVYRIAFHLAGPDPRLALREEDDLDSSAWAALADKLRRLDRAGPWTLPTLRLIGECEGRSSAELADMLGLERPALKQRIRKLKELGLTESLEVGYRLSKRGQAVLARLPG